MTKYHFKEVDSHATSKIPRSAKTKKALVMLWPDSSKSWELRTVEIEITNPLEDSRDVAYKELKKVLLRHAYPYEGLDLFGAGSKLDSTSFFKNGKTTTAKFIQSAASFVSEWDDDGSGKGLKINVDSESIALTEFYDAMQETNPMARYSRLFRALEYLCVPRSERSHPLLKNGLQNGLWCIPSNVSSELINIIRAKSWKGDQVDYLWDLRSRADHLKHSDGTAPDYGLNASKSEDMAEVYQGAILLREILDRSLELNPHTKE